MANNRQRSIRLEKRRAVLEKRGALPQADKSVLNTGGYIPRSRFAVKEEQKQRQLNSLIKKVNNAKDLKEIKRIIQQSPSTISREAKQILNQVENQQKNLINQLNQYLNVKKSGERKYDERADKAREEGNRERYKKYRIKEEEYSAEAKAINEVLNDVLKGSLYNFGSITKYVNDVGKSERGSTGYYLEKQDAKARAEKLSRKLTIEKIQKAGYTTVIDKQGNLLGYETPISQGRVQYRFDKQGNPYFYSSPQFKPVKSDGKLTGYVDLISKQSIPLPNLDKRLKDINKQKNEYKKFQDALKKIKLPSDYGWIKDKEGNILRIDDKKMGVCLDLGELPTVTRSYLLNPYLRDLFTVSGAKSLKEALTFFPKKPNQLRGLDAFSPKKYRDFIIDLRYKNYKNIGGKFNRDKFDSLNYRLLTPQGHDTLKKENPKEYRKIILSVSKQGEDMLQNPERYGTQQRLNALLALYAFVSGGGLKKTIPITLYGGTMNVAINLPKKVYSSSKISNPKELTRVIVKNFGIGALQGLTYGLIFSSARLVGKPLLKITLKGASKLGLTKAVQEIIRRGLSILGVLYLSNLAGRTTRNVKNIVVGDQELGVAGLSKDVGLLAGFGLPSLAKKIVSGSKDLSKIKINKKTGKVLKITPNQKKELQKEIRRLEELRKGQLNSVYIKAKNAQAKDLTFGTYKSLGKSSKLDKKIIKSLSSKGRGYGLNENRLMDGAYYSQTINVRSSVPKTEATLKVLKSILRKGSVPKIKGIPDVYQFKRYGIITTVQTKSGTAKAIAIEFNLSNGRATAIGFKTGISKGDKALIRMYVKAKDIKGIQKRAKLQDVYIVKGKFKGSTKLNEQFVKELNKLEIKKVFLDGKRISSKQLSNLKNRIRQDLSQGNKPNIENILNNIFKNQKISGRTGVANTMRIKRVGDKYSIKLLNKKDVVVDVSPKGRYVEFGIRKYTIPKIKTDVRKAGIPKNLRKRFDIKSVSKRQELILEPKIISKKTTKGIPKNLRKRFDIKSVSKRQELILEPKRSITKTQTRNLRESIMSIQTIVKPRARVSRLNKVIPKSIISNLIKGISVLLPLVSTKNESALKTIQSNLNKSLSIQKTSSLMRNEQAISLLKSLQYSTLKQLQAIKASPSINEILMPTKRVTRKKPSKKKVIPIPIPKKAKTKTKKIIKGKRGYRSASSIKRKVSQLNKIPLTKERALDILAYNLDKTKSSRGRTIKGLKRVSPSILKRELKRVPKNYFRRNRKKFILRKLKKGRETYEMIERKKYRKDSLKEKRGNIKRKR